ncbi:MAG: Verru_Chthon cassette protein A, partial [Verrucomicrobiales bacterium]
MKLAIQPPSKDRPITEKKQRGVALVTVMSILSVLTVLSVAIISLAGNELRSARSYSDSVRTRQLSEYVTSLVIGQIREATRTDKKVGGGLFGGGAIALWASQPGMIRTFADEGELLTAFKLYSSTKMTMEDEREIVLEEESIREWEQSPERFVDLNAPSIAYNTKGQETNRYFPILDPRAKTLDKVEAFDFDAFPGVREGKRLPMPVEWIYVLKDGKMGNVDSSGKFISSDPTAQADVTNPISARIAFWADDETCKINVNTAAEGIPWDKPKANTDLAKLWSQYQPVIHEVQRYPGHPATTCLSALFFPGKYVGAEGANELSKNELRAILEITPKVEWGGTEDGQQKGTKRLEYDSDRLYASVDDIVFNIKREDNKFVDLLPDGLERFERAKGFMTVRSQGPELNIHGRPRISLWAFHVNDNPKNRTTLDDTIEFCTSLGDRGQYKFFFQRRDATSRHHEFYNQGKPGRSNVDLYMYLMAQVYKKVPSYGKSMAQKYGAKKKAPFKPAHYTDKNEYKLDHFAIALQMFDYMRQVNIHDGNLAEPYADFKAGSNSGFGQISGINLIGRKLQSDGGSSEQSSNWHKSTLEPRGSGRMFTISEVALVMYITAETTLKSFGENGKGVFSGDKGPDVNILKRVLNNEHPQYAKWRGRKFNQEDVGHTFGEIEVGMIPEAFSVAQGFHQIHPKQTIRILTGGTGYKKGLDEASGLKINNVPLEFWGTSNESSGQEGPAIYTVDAGSVDARQDLPAGWHGWGGARGQRPLRF